MNTSKIIIICQVIFTFILMSCIELNPKTDGHIQSALQAQKDNFRACYEDAIKEDGEVKGEIGILLNIDKSGKVTDASVEKSDINSDAMKECVASKAKEITLPEPPNAIVEGHYTISFDLE